MVKINWCHQNLKLVTNWQVFDNFLFISPFGNQRGISNQTSKMGRFAKIFISDVRLGSKYVSRNAFQEFTKICCNQSIFWKVNYESIIGSRPNCYPKFKFNNRNTRKVSEICSKLKRKTPIANDVILVSSLLTLNSFQTFFFCFRRWLWTCKCQQETLIPKQPRSLRN